MQPLGYFKTLKISMPLICALFLLFGFIHNFTSANHAYAMPPTPFVCDGTIYISQGNSTATGLYTVNSSTSPFGLDLVFGSGGFQYNSMGYNVINGEIHALVRSTGGGYTKGDFISIDGAGTITNYGQPNVAPNDSYSGDVDENGIHYLVKQKNLWAYDTNDPNYPTLMAGYPKTMAFNAGADIAYNPKDGLLYSISGSKLNIINPLSGVTTRINLTAPTGETYAAINSAGAMWVDAAGIIFGYQNSGYIYTVDPATGVSTRVSTATNVSTNDGTGCAYAPIFTKSITPSTFKPGDILTYEFVIVNGLLQSNLAYDFEDTLPGDLTFITNTLTITGDLTITGTGTANSYAGTSFLSIDDFEIEAAGTATITIQAATTFDTLPGTYINHARMTELLPSLGGTKFSDWSGGSEFGEPTPGEATAERILTIDKTLAGNLDQDGSGNISVNDTLTYTFVISNEGDLRMHNVMMDDPLSGLSPLTCAPAQPLSLDPATGYSCFATYNVTQLDIDNGAITNTASVSGADIGGTTAGDSDTVVTATAQNPELTLLKLVDAVEDVDTSTTFSAGDIVTYTFTVTNTGDTTLENVRVNDPLPGISTPICAPAQGSTLGLGGTMTCTATYTLQQPDINNGDVINTATATGMTPNGISVDDNSTASVIATEAPDITLDKTYLSNADEDSSNDVSVNDTLTYQFVITNSGNVSLTDIQVDDPLPGLSTVSCPAGGLLPNNSKTCTATYSVRQTDVDNGSIVNTATTSGDSPADTTVTSNDTATVPVAQNPAIEIEKTLFLNADEDGSLDRTLNDTLTYRFVITNSGDVALNNVSVNDPLVNPATLSCSPAISSTLALGQSMVCTAGYVIAQIDIENGAITNTATATGETSTNISVDDTDTIVSETAQKPAISLDKKLNGYTDADISSDISPGDTLTFGFVLTNTGNVSLNNVQLIDTLINTATLSCAPTLGSSLAIGAVMSCSAEHVVTQTERDNGQVVNSATATGESPANVTVQDFDIEIVPVPQDPSLNLLKEMSGYQDLDNSGEISVGDLLTYTFTVTNNGDVTLQNVTVTDPLTVTGLSAVTCSPGQGSTLPLGGTMVCQATYPVGQDDINKGTVDNEATVTGTTPNGFTEDAKSATSTALNQIPIVQLEKFPFTSSGDANALAFGDILTYTFTATNTGNVTLNNFTITDPLPGLSALSCTPGNNISREPGESISCSATYTVTMADILVGQISNEATVNAIDPTGEAVQDSDDYTGPRLLQPSVEVDKTMSDYVDGDNSGDLSVGDVLTFTIDINNTGNTALFDIQLVDTLPGISQPVCNPNQGSTLGVGTSMRCTANYTLTQAAIDGAFIVNMANISATTPLTPSVVLTDTVSENVPLPQIPFVVLEKTISGNSDPDGSGTVTVGDTLTYTLTASNDGNLTLSNVVISDTLPGLTPFMCDGAMPATLAPGQTLSCSTNYLVLQSDGDSGMLSNTAVVTSTAPNGDPVTDDDTINTPIPIISSIELTKRANPASDPQIGDPITYTLVATNTGNVTLSNVVISDTLAGLGPINCNVAQPATLLPDEVLTCTTVLPAVTQAQVDFGSITNNANVTSTDPDGYPIEDDDTLDIPIPPAPAIVLNKSVTPVSGAMVSDTITFTLTAVNNGNTTLNNVIITDTLPGLSGLTCDGPMPASLPSAGQLSCTATYTVTQADIDNGSITNSGSVSGSDVNNIPVSDDDTATATFPQNPSVVLDKSFAGTTGDPAFLTLGDVISYSLVVTNTGNVTLDNVTVSDPLITNGSLTCSPGSGSSLAPGLTMSCVATYTVTITDVNVGEIFNTGTVSAEDPQDNSIDDSDIEVVPPNQRPAIEILKSVAGSQDIDQSGNLSAGDLLTYTFTISNTGNVTLNDVQLGDPLPGLGPLSCLPAIGATLQPADQMVCQAIFTLTQSIIDTGLITNTAFVTVTTPLTTTPTLTNTATITTPIPSAADLEFLKTMSGSFDADGSNTLSLGDTLTYTFVITNSGNVTLFNVRISDPLVGLGPISCALSQPGGVVRVLKIDTVIPVIAPGEWFVCTAAYTLTQADVDAGERPNTATAAGTDPAGNPVTDTDSETVPIPQNPDLSLIKAGTTQTEFEEGELIIFTFQAVNTGDVAMTDVEINDPLPGLSPLVCQTPSPVTLQPGEWLYCEATYAITPADVLAGEVLNTAQTTGNDPSNATLTDNHSVDIPRNGQDPLGALDIEKSTNGEDADVVPGPTIQANQTVTWTYTVTNNGTDIINEISVLDNREGVISCPATTLAAGESMFCTHRSLAVFGQYSNTATVSGRSAAAGAPLLTDADSSHYLGSVDPTAVELISFSASRSGQNSIEISWETGSEINNFGFRLVRSETSLLTDSVQVHFENSAVTSGPGARYTFKDAGLAPKTYTYWLIDVETTGVETVHGPVEFSLAKTWQVYLPNVFR
ncbi:MAG: hypothetical protein AB8G95_20070 [Anaerolineae bacterium]